MYKRVREWKEAFLVWLAEKADRTFHISVLDAEGVNTAKKAQSTESSVLTITRHSSH